MSDAKPLSGIRVLDFGRYVAGPWAATLLADFGADVIRIDRIGGSEDRWIAPVTDNGEGALFLQVNRNKRAITLDARTEDGREIQRRLIATADVVVSNVPTSALAAMGIDYASLIAIKPDVIACNVSSFGPRGPWADRPGFDSVGQAMGGSAYLSGPGNQPYRSPVTWVDHMTALYAGFGIMAALQERHRSGRGQEVSASLLGSALAASGTFLVEQAAAQTDREAIGNRSFLNGPTDTFATRDSWVVTQVVGNPIFRRWCSLIGESHWLDDPRFASDALRGENGAVLSERMAQWCAERTSEQALDELAQAGIPAGPILSLQGALDHPQARAMEFMVSQQVAGLADPAALMRLPLDLSLTPSTIDRPPPAIGEHNHEVLTELGFSSEEIGAMASRRAI